MHFDGASNALGNGIGAVIISPQGTHTPLTARLCFNCTNNMAEYEACIMGLKAAIDLRIKFLSVFGDSALVINQIKGEWDTKHPNLIPYKECVLTLIPHFAEITFEHFPREENQLGNIDLPKCLLVLPPLYSVATSSQAPYYFLPGVYD